MKLYFSEPSYCPLISRQIIQFIVLLSFSESLATKCLLLNDEPFSFRPTLVDINPIELEYYPFMISLNKCTGSCNVLSPKIYIPKELILRATRRRSDVVTTSQMKHPKTSLWNVTKTSQLYVSTISYWNVVTTSQEVVTTASHQRISSTSQTSLKWNTQWRLSGTSPRRLSGTYPWRPISTPLRRLV